MMGVPRGPYRQGLPNQEFPLGGGYGPSAQAEEFYEESEEYYDEDGYEEEVYYPQEYEYEPPPVRRFPMLPGHVRPPHPGPSHGHGPPILRAGIDFMRRDHNIRYEEDYGVRRPPLAPAAHLVARNPVSRYGQAEGVISI